METPILIPLVIVILILLFAGSRQKKEFRHTEDRLRKALFEKIKEVELLQSQHRPSSKGVNPSKPTYKESPPELFHTNIYWPVLSEWYRKEQHWTCERCAIDLKSRKQFLDTHHILGRGHNSPDHLKALCVKCHSDSETAR